MLDTYFQDQIALGSKVTLLVVADKSQSDFVEDLFKGLWRTILYFEKQFSRFLPNSELSQFNRSAGPKKHITPEFRDLLLAAKQMSEESRGSFNPFILPALQRAGYTKSMVKAYADDKHDDFSKLPVVEASKLTIGDDWAMIPHGTAIDIGGCGKGYLGDLFIQLMQDKPVAGFWFSLGGDVVGAGHDASGKPWQVIIGETEDNLDENSLMITPGSEPFAVATSGTRTRAGKHNGKDWHHIIDPRTLESTTTDVRMATIYGNSAVRADVFASGAIIDGSGEAVKFLKTQKSIKAAVLQGIDKNGEQFVKRFGKEVKQYNSVSKEAISA